MTKKKDPLKDNRIFPEEMHEKPKNNKNDHRHFSWFWFVIGAAVLIFLIWLGFIYQFDNQIPVPETENTEIQQQRAAFDAMQNSRGPITQDMREERINQLFGN